MRSNGMRGVAVAAALAGALGGSAALAWAAPTGASPRGGAPAPPPARPSPAVFFETRVRPVLAERCFACHAERVQLSGLRLDSREAILKGGKGGPAVVPGSPEKSPLVEVLSYHGKLKMPPAGKLKADEIAALTDWVRMGAPWPAGTAAGKAPRAAAALWALRPLRAPAVPAVRMKSWVKNPIDAFVLAELEKRGLKPSPAADRRTLIRRVSLDLIGLPPTPDEVEAFVADRTPGAYERLVDRLLASPAYGERAALLWMDLARYADSDGYHDDTDRAMWGFRDYVIRAFNQDKPFNTFTVEQIAGDLLPNATFEQKVASAFNRCGPTTSEGGAIPEEVLARYAVDRVNTTASVWLGLTIQCAECHDHKYDPLTARDFYRLSAYFNQVPEEALYRGADAPPVIDAPTPEQVKRLAELDREIAAADAETKPRAGATDPKAEEARVADARKRLESLRHSRKEVERFTKLRIMADVPQRRPTFLLVRGDYRNRGEEVQPGVPEALGGLAPDAPKNRLALARWLVDPSNPLPPRVTVNRFWQMVWGAGLVKTSEDYGTRGETPSHPELLDWLAAAFVAPAAAGGDRAPNAPQGTGLGWSVKRLLRLIVTSAAYQQSSRVTPALRARDPENRLLARGARYRLPAELIRDNALAAAGLLDRSRPVGGPSVKPYQPGDLWRELAANDQEAKSYVQDHGPDLYRRGLYTVWKRSVLYPAFAVFDAPKREVTTCRRLGTNTPLQAFVTMNDTAYVEAARVLAQRLMQSPAASVDARLDMAFRTVLARPAAAAERQSLGRLYRETLEVYRKDRDGALKLASVGEWARPAELDPAEHAAWTCVCNALLNLDETITRE